MRNRIRKMPSGSMAVAFTALLIALGGTAVALPGSNTVTGGDIKRGAVASSDIRNNSVRSGDVRNSTLRGADVLNNTLTGSDVNEGSLGIVPSATTAVSSLNSLGLGGRAANTIVSTNRGAMKKMSIDGPETPLVTVGPFTASIDCIDDGGSNPVALFLINTTETNSVANRAAGVGGPNPFDLDPGEPQEDRVFFTLTDGPDPTFNSTLSWGGGTPSGRRVAGTITLGTNVLGADCVGWGDGFEY